MCAIFKGTFGNTFIPEICLNVSEHMQTHAHMPALSPRKKKYFNETISPNAPFLMLLKHLALFSDKR